MSIPQKINDLLTGIRPKALCNSCIAEMLNMKNKTAHPAQVTNALGTTSDFIHETAECSRCGQTKKVIWRS